MTKLTTTRARELGKKSSRKGIPNKATAEVREMFKDFLNDNWHTIQSDLNKLEPYERIKILLEFSKFVIPTLKSTELKTEDGKKITPISGIIINND